MKEEKAFDVGILLYQGVDILELAGPLEVFAAAKGFSTYNVGLVNESVSSRGNLGLLPDCSLQKCPHLDVLVVPGGAVEEVQQNAALLRWLQAMTIKTSILMSVCTGAFLFAAAGLLDGRNYTSASQALNKLPKMVNGGRFLRDVRFVDSGNIITTAGPSSGIDGALHVVKRLKGTAEAQTIAQYLEYPLWPDAATSNRTSPIRRSENTGWLGNK